MVDRAKAGDPAAYERTFERVADRLLLYIRVRLGERLRSKVEALDILQDAYLEAHRGFASFEPQGEGAYIRWLYSIVDNRIRNAADYFGAKKRDTARELRSSGIFERVRTYDTGPSTACARREEHIHLARALDDLEDEMREVLLLRYFHGLTIQEIVDRTSLTNTTARRTLARGALLLGSHLKGIAADVGPE